MNKIKTMLRDKIKIIKLGKKICHKFPYKDSVTDLNHLTFL